MYFDKVNDVWPSFYLARATMNKHIWILETFKDKGKIGPAKVHQSWMVVEHGGHLRYWYQDEDFLINNADTSRLI